MLAPLDRTRRRPIDRSGDRVVAAAGIGISLAFLAAAVASLLLPTEVRRGAWLPLHLALAGGATSAIAGVLPFFVAAFATAPPASSVLRAASLVAVALGAVAVTAGVVGGQPAVAVAGGVTFVTGIALVAASTLQPLRGGLGPSRGIVTRAYVVALAMVGVGALLATLYVAGWAPVLEAWERLRPAHAWLNLVGFVSLVIAATLIHFFPTVVGTRIGAHTSGRVALTSLAVGPPIVAAGYAVGLDLVVRLGAVLSAMGALALAVYAGRIWMARSRWTTDPAWHRFAIGGLISAIGWFVIGMGVLGARTIAAGASPAGWAVEPLIGPLVAGWVALSILGSATHLLPAVGPGDQAVHARQRRVLGSLSWSRLIALDLGAAGVSLGLAVGAASVLLAGAIVYTVALGLTLGLVARALGTGLVGRAREDRRPPTSHPG